MRYRLPLILSRTRSKGKRMQTLLVDCSMMESICEEMQTETTEESGSRGGGQKPERGRLESLPEGTTKILLGQGFGRIWRLGV